LVGDFRIYAFFNAASTTVHVFVHEDSGVFVLAFMVFQVLSGTIIEFDVQCHNVTI
jgi:hypothetical protein